MARGDPAVGLYEVVSGKVRQVRIDPEGRDIVVGIACAGDMIAEASLFSPLHDCAATAVTKATVRLHRRAGLLAEFERNPQAACVHDHACESNSKLKNSPGTAEHSICARSRSPLSNRKCGRKGADSCLAEHREGSRGGAWSQRTRRVRDESLR